MLIFMAHLSEGIFECCRRRKVFYFYVLAPGQRKSTLIKLTQHPHKPWYERSCLPSISQGRLSSIYPPPLHLHLLHDGVKREKKFNSQADKICAWMETFSPRQTYASCFLRHFSRAHNKANKEKRSRHINLFRSQRAVQSLFMLRFGFGFFFSSKLFVARFKSKARREKLLIKFSSFALQMS